MSNNSEDQFILASSMMPQNSEFITEKRDIITLNDTNGGSYSGGSIIFDGNAISNSGRAADWANSVLAIPTVLKVSGDVGDNPANVFAASWKNSIHAIHSLSVQISNSTVVEVHEFQNIPCSFKLLTELSKQEMESFKYSYGFNKDNALSLGIQSANGIYAPATYESNNNPNSPATALAANVGYNSVGVGGIKSQNGAMLERMMDTSYDVSSYGDATQRSALQQTGKSTCVREANYVVYHGVITLPLKFLHPLFEKMPLVRNAFFKMTFYSNLISKTVLTMAGGAYTAVASSLSAKTCPYMISPISIGLIAPAAGTITLESGIGKIDNISNPCFQVCKLFVPVYTLNPDYAERYFSMGPKSIKYNNYSTCTTATVKANQPLNAHSLGNSQSRIRGLLVFPVRTFDLNNPQNPFLSPFTSSPSTTAPYAIVSNFNVKIAGSNHYTEGSINYSWETFQGEILKRGLNANLERSLGSGLLNQLEWESGYRFLYVDLTRKTGQGSDDVAKSVTVDLINSSPHCITYHFFIEFEKEITLNVSTGQLTNERGN